MESLYFLSEAAFKRVDGLSEEVKALSQKLTSFEQASKESKQLMELSASSIKEHASKIAMLEGRITKAEESLTGLEQFKQSLGDVEAMKKSAVKVPDSDMEAQKVQIQSLLKRVSEMEQKADQKLVPVFNRIGVLEKFSSDQKAAEIKKRAEDQSSNGQKGQELSSLRSMIESLQSRINEQESKIMAQESMVKEQASTIIDQGSKIASQSSQIAEQNSKLADQGAKISTQGATIADHSDKIRAQGVKVAPAQSDSVGADSASLAMLQRINSELSEMKVGLTRIGSIEKDISKNRSDIGALENLLRSHSTQIGEMTTIDSKFNSLKQDVDQALVKVQEIGLSKVDSTKTEYTDSSALKSRLAALEEAIKNIPSLTDISSIREDIKVKGEVTESKIKDLEQSTLALRGSIELLSGNSETAQKSIVNARKGIDEELKRTEKIISDKEEELNKKLNDIGSRLEGVSSVTKKAEEDESRVLMQISNAMTEIADMKQTMLELSKMSESFKDSIASLKTVNVDELKRQIAMLSEDWESALQAQVNSSLTYIRHLHGGTR